MSGRRRVNLRRLATLGTGHTPSRQKPEYWVDCTIPWLTLADVWQLRDGTMQTVTETSEKISKIGLANSAAVLHPAGTVAMSRTASVGFTCILGIDIATSQDYVTWTCGPNLIPRFLLYALRGLRNEILGMKMGSTHQTIYMPDIERIAIPAPPVQIQESIADFLDVETVRIDTLIAKKRQLLQAVSDRIDVVREHIFAPLSCQYVPLMHLTDPYRPIVYGIVQAGPEFPGGIPYIKTGDLPVLNVESLSRVSPEVHRRYLRAVVRPGDIVISMRASIGAVAMIPPFLLEANLTQGTARIAPSRDTDGRWLFQAIQTRAVQEQCRIRAVGTTFRTLNIWDLRRIVVPIVPKVKRADLLQKFDSECSKHRKVSAMLSRQLVLLHEYRQALITAAVTGEMDIPGVSR